MKLRFMRFVIKVLNQELTIYFLGGRPPALQQLPQPLLSLFTHNGRVSQLSFTQVKWPNTQVEVVDFHMDDAKIGEGRTEAKVFTQNQIEKMGERISVTEEMGISILSMLFQLNL